MSDIILQQNISYDEIYKQLQSLFAGEKNPLANMANMSSLLYFSIQNINWIGFYMRHAHELVLGPFHGKPACVRIQIGKGVCGNAVMNAKTLVIDDVHQFVGHIACDTDTRSEIVIPLFNDNNVIGVLDIDSPIPNRFGDKEKLFFERCASLILDSSTNWRNILF